MPLIDPLAPGTVAELEPVLGLYQQTLGFTPNSVLTMQRRPELALAFVEMNRAVMANHGRLTPEQKRLIGFLASTAAGCRYCQAHTALAAQRFGASAARLQAIWDYAESDLFTPAEKAAFDLAVAASAVPNAVTPEIAAAARAHWDDGEIVEIVGVVALFGFLNRWNDSMGTTLEPGAKALGAAQLAPHGWSVGKHR